MKKLIMLLVTIVSLSTLTACGEVVSQFKDGFNTAVGVEQYAEDMKSLYDRQTQIGDEYKNAVANSTDPADGIEALNKGILDFEQLLQDAKTVNTPSPSIEKIHMKYIESLELQLGSIVDMRDAVLSNDQDLMTQAEEKMRKSKAVWDEMNQLMEQL